jgi:hypothetical protein
MSFVPNQRSRRTLRTPSGVRLVEACGSRSFLSTSRVNQVTTRHQLVNNPLGLGRATEFVLSWVSPGALSSAQKGRGSVSKSEHRMGANENLPKPRIVGSSSGNRLCRQIPHKGRAFELGYRNPDCWQMGYPRILYQSQSSQQRRQLTDCHTWDSQVKKRPASAKQKRAERLTVVGNYPIVARGKGSVCSKLGRHSR